MGLGGAILLIALGLILGFAVDFQIAGIDLQLIGHILTGVGILGLILWFLVWGPRRRALRSTTVRSVDPVAGSVAAPVAGGAVRERRVYDEEPL